MVRENGCVRVYTCGQCEHKGTWCDGIEVANIQGVSAGNGRSN